MHPLQAQIRAIARRARRLGLLYGLARVVTLVVAAGSALILLDWLLRYDDAGVRAIATAVFAAIAGWSIVRYLATAWMARFGDVAVAQNIERRFPTLRDRLSNTMAFLAQSESESTAGSTDLRRTVVADTTAAVEAFDLHAALDARAARGALVTLFVVLLAALGLAAADASAAKIGIARLLNPVGDDAWPRRNHLEFQPPVTQLASGTTFEVTLGDRNGHLPDEVRIAYRYDGEDAPHLIEPMIPRGDRMIARRENVTRGFFYRAIGGDDRGMAEVRLDVVEPPQIASVKLTLIPPAYTGWPATSTVGAIHALKKTRVAVIAKVDKPLAKAAVLLENDRRIPATLAADRRGFEITDAAGEPWEIDDSRWYAFELVGLDGVSTPKDDLARWEIRPVADHPPSITLIEPGENLYVTPQALAPIQVLAKDDFAVRRVTLLVQHMADANDSNTKNTPTTIELYEGKNPVPPSAAGSLAKSGPQSDLPPLAHEWDLSSLKIQPGDVLELSAIAQDYQPAKATSPPRRAFIISMAQFEDRLAERQARILADLGRALDTQRQARARTEALETAAAAPSGADKSQIDALQTMRHLQKQVTRLLTAPNDGAVAQTEALLREMRNNRLDASPAAERWTALVAELNRLNRSHLAELDHRLLTLADRLQETIRPSGAVARPPEFRDHLTDVARLQDESLAVLQKLSDRLTEIDGARRLARDIEALHETQTGLARRAAEMAASALGKSTADLTADEQAELARLAKAQLDAAAQLERIESRMAPLAKQLKSSDSRVASAIEQAHETLRQEALAGQMREASRQLTANRVGQAGEQQSRIAERLGSLSELLSGRQQRPADGLVKKLRSARQDLDRAAAEQDGLRKKAKAAREKTDAQSREELARLTKRQRELEQRAEKLARELRTLQARRPAASLDAAAKNMARAADSDDKPQGDAQQAEAAQAQAGQALRQAQQQLADEIEQKEIDLLRQQQARLEDALPGLIARQENVRAETAKRDGATAARDEAARLAVAELAQEQRQLHDEVARLAAEIENAEVAVLVLRHTADDMRRAADGLKNDQTGADTQSAQDAAVVRLKQLLAATKPSPPSDLDNPSEPEAKKPENGKKSDSKNRSPRMMSELRLLAALQDEINRRTLALEKSRQAGVDLTPEQQRLYDQLAVEQGQIAELLLKLTQD